MGGYSIEPRTKKSVKGYAFLSFARKYKKQRIRCFKKKVAHKVSEYLGNKISDAVTRSNDVNIGKQ